MERQTTCSRNWCSKHIFLLSVSFFSWSPSHRMGTTDLRSELIRSRSFNYWYTILFLNERKLALFQRTLHFTLWRLKLSKFLQRTCAGISYFPCHRLHVLISSTGTQKSRQYRKGKMLENCFNGVGKRAKLS